MEFIQLGNDYHFQEDAFCFGLKQLDTARERNDLYKFREHPNSQQNGGIGWYCEHIQRTSFKLTIIF